MLELNQRSDALHQRDLEIQRLQEQLRLVESAVEDGATQLEPAPRARRLRAAGARAREPAAADASERRRPR
jgi:hypothetical protein